jgi:hypothetical protein
MIEDRHTNLHGKALRYWLLTGEGQTPGSFSWPRTSGATREYERLLGQYEDLRVHFYRALREKDRITHENTAYRKIFE